MTRRILFSIFCLMMGVCLAAGGCTGKSTESDGGITKTYNGGVMNAMVKEIEIRTTVTPGGQFPESLKVKLNEAYSGDVDASDFLMRGHATNWMDPSLHDFSASFTNAVVEDDVLTLTFGEFKDKFFFVQDWQVLNDKDEKLSFSSENNHKIIAPVADAFEYHSVENGEAFNYHLFTPDHTDTAMPLVVVFHGFADTHNLLAYRTSVAWAEPEAQAKRPCYVLSPVVADEVYFTGDGRAAVFDALHEKIKDMVEAGKVDPDRIYVMGNSFGGMSTIEYMEQFPNTVTGALALCSALNYSQTAMDGLNVLNNTPIWIAHAEHDNTIASENSKEMYARLVDAGNDQVKLKIYSDEEMNAAGGSSDPDSTFSYHHVEMAVMEDEAYAEWLFKQKLNK